MNTIRTIIFDLGAVLLNIDLKKAVAAFSELSGKSEEELSSRIYETTLFNQHEIGAIDNDTFLAKLGEELGVVGQSQALAAAWDKVLLDFPQERIEMLKKLKPNHRLLLLSNTNELHVLSFNQQLARENGVPGGLPELLDGVYYSSRMGFRKPDPAIFKSVIQAEGLKPEETLFIDDNPANCTTARSLGFQVEQMNPNSGDFSFFKEYNITY
ncbi:HAD family phosphatase [Persicobacter diffluens]|uniref:Haloacid dehalogenase n=1 Tax=Persicobacter diffluens TaxID=981 RepID=A0AAN4VXK0_9BACT|nr:haloacid dehalogenase [Persicobacter diffluens]